jgi:hypothetical protein
LEATAYADLGQPPWPDHGPPPYEHKYGSASYEVCDCCGFEFGYDDNPGTAPPLTFDEYRKQWIASGAESFDPAKRPESWSLSEQLSRIGIHE